MTTTGPTVRVLMVDDHPTFRSGLGSVLATDAGIEVVGQAASGEEALVLARAQPPDVVVMDLSMPGIGGVEATRRLVRERDAVRVLVLTMSDADASVFAALRAGAHGYLLKDAQPEEILRAVHGVGQGEAVFGPGVAGRVLAYFTSSVAARVRPFPELSEREREVLELLARGRDNAAIAAALFLSPKTVRNHVSNVIAKVHAADRSDAIVRGRDAGFGTGPGGP